MILPLGCVLFVLLIAYWWANAGVFDALMHLACVIAAGALALALWEPVTTALLLTPTLVDYAWGLSLGGLFLGLLAALRITMDKLCPVRPKVARWADWVFGGLMGAASGVLTIGLVLIAVGHVAGAREIAGYEGWKREPGDPAPRQTADGLGGIVAIIVDGTGGFYNLVSGNAFAPFLGNASLATVRPGIAADGMSLLRDSVDAGKGRLGVTPTGLSVAGFYRDTGFGLLRGGTGAFAVLISAKQPAFDAQGGFTLSASQARLIDGSTGASAFPAEFAQREENSGDSLVRYAFRGDSDYLGTLTSSAESVACLVFPSAPFGSSKGPFYLQVKGLRFALPEPTPGPEGIAKAVQSGGKAMQLADASDAPVVPADQLRTDNGVQGMMLDKNALPGSLKEDGGRLIGGAAERISRSGVAAGDVRYIDEPSGSKLVVLRCSGNSAVDLFDIDRTRKAATRAGPGAQPVLIDDKQNIYAPSGYIWRDEQRNEFEVYLEPPKEGFTLKRFARAATNGELFILYRVPEGTTLKLVALRDPARSMADAVMVGRCSYKVESFGKKP